jgi:heptosyltransferase-3
MKPQSFKKILIIATRQIGDTLITTPLIERAHELWPQAHIDFLGFSGAVGILKGNPFLNQIIGSSPKPSFKEYLSLIRKIFFKYDLAIITQPSDRSYIYGLLAAHHRVGVCHIGKEDHGWKKWITQHQVPIDYFSQHVVIEKLHLLDPFISQKTYSHQIQITPPEFESIPRDIDELAKDCVVLHPSPLNDYKCWPIDHWVGLMEYFSNQHIPVVISGGPNEKDQRLATLLLDRLSEQAQHNTMNLSGKMNFSTLAHLLHVSRAYIGVDTSITHLAAACRTPTIALFGATPPTNFGPWPNGFEGTQPYSLRAATQTVENVTILQGPGDCVPCRKAGCDDTSNSRSLCMEQLSLERVITAFEGLGKTIIPIQSI